MRNAALVRVLKLAEQLRGGRFELDTLARDFHVSARTVRRDLEALGSAGIRVRHSDADAQGPSAVWWIDTRPSP